MYIINGKNHIIKDTYPIIKGCVISIIGIRIFETFDKTFI